MRTSRDLIVEAFHKRLDKGDVLVGMQSFSRSPVLVETIGLAGFDFAMIDMEHSPASFADIEELVRAADCGGLLSLVRVAENHGVAIRKALETGAAGVIIPQVRTGADVIAAVQSAHYPPQGVRGMCPSIRAAGYSLVDWDVHAASVRTESLVVPLIEHPDSVANIDEICSVEGVKVVFFGPGDFGLAIGQGAAGFRSDAVIEAFDAVAASAKAHGVHVMTVPFPAFDVPTVELLLNRGVRLMMHSIDEIVFARACKEIVADVTDASRRWMDA